MKTFVLHWKTCGRSTIHGYEALETGSPKIILKTAYKAGMINDEEPWMKALEARNNVACAI